MGTVLLKKWNDYVVTKRSSSVYQKNWRVIIPIKFNNLSDIIIT